MNAGVRVARSTARRHALVPASPYPRRGGFVVAGRLAAPVATCARRRAPRPGADVTRFTVALQRRRERARRAALGGPARRPARGRARAEPRRDRRLGGRSASSRARPRSSSSTRCGLRALRDRAAAGAARRIRAPRARQRGMRASADQPDPRTGAGRAAVFEEKVAWWKPRVPEGRTARGQGAGRPPGAQGGRTLSGRQP